MAAFAPATTESNMPSTGALYGVIGAMGIVLVGGGLYIAQQQGAFGPPSSTAALSPQAPASAPAPTPAPAPPPAAKPPVIATPAPPPPAPAPVGPDAGQLEQVRLLVVDARRAITRGDFNAADRALLQAERIDPRSADVVATRHDLRDAEHRAARGDRRVDSLVADARAAIARHDYAAADRLLIQAEQIDARDRGVQQARTELANRVQADRSDRKIDALVAQARAAIARHDYAEADRLLDQAENLDAHDRDVQQARAELNTAQRRR
jgi:hypothetical protein